MLGSRNKRLMKEKEMLLKEGLENIRVSLSEDLSTWYCKIFNLKDEYLEGEYILKIEIPTDYPFSPPDFYMLTPNGRFELNKKLCFSNSGYHKESWNPLWNMKTIILGFLSFFLEQNSGGVGHLHTTTEIKKKYALESKSYNLKYNSKIVFDTL